MPKRPTRNRTPFTSTIDPEKHVELKDISSQTDIPISKLLDRAIQLLKEDCINKGIYNPNEHNQSHT